MKNTLYKTVLTTGALLPTLAMAHPGHDHTSPFAFLIHLVWIAPALIAVGLVAYYVKRKNQASK